MSLWDTLMDLTDFSMTPRKPGEAWYRRKDPDYCRFAWRPGSEVRNALPSVLKPDEVLAHEDVQLLFPPPLRSVLWMDLKSVEQCVERHTYLV